MVFRLGNHRNAVHYAKICCPHPCVSCLVVDLGARTKCGHFSKLYANNYVWKNVKIKNKINLGPVVLTGHILAGKGADSDIFKRIKAII